MGIHGDQTSWEWKEKTAGVSIFLSLWSHGPWSLLLSAHLCIFLPASTAQACILLSLNFSWHVALLRTILVHASLT